MASKKSTTTEKKYTPSEREHAAVARIAERKDKHPGGPYLTIKHRNGRNEIGVDHVDEMTGVLLLMDSIGTNSGVFLNGLLKQLSNAGTQGPGPDEENVNFMLSVVQSIEPKDEIEAMLASQMAAVHMATMTFARRLAHVENIPQQESAEKAFNKLARTFAAQVDTLKRHRTGGQQKITVERVTVNDGGQAIVGNVSGGGQKE